MLVWTIHLRVWFFAWKAPKALQLKVVIKRASHTTQSLSLWRVYFPFIWKTHFTQNIFRTEDPSNWKYVLSQQRQPTCSKKNKSERKPHTFNFILHMRCAAPHNIEAHSNSQLYHTYVYSFFVHDERISSYKWVKYVLGAGKKAQVHFNKRSSICKHASFCLETILTKLNRFVGKFPLFTKR